jgi:phosphate transport system protein
MRERFERKLNELRDDILKMGSMVEEELKLALRALEALDTNLACQVFDADTAVNAMRFSIEEKCFELIVTQQPAAGDLRAIVAVMNMIVDLERMGDQAKGIAKVISHMVVKYPNRSQPPELEQMGDMVGIMLRQSMTAYAHNNVDLAELVASQDDEVDRLYARVFTQIMEQMAQTKNPDKVEASYEILRAARELERFGDLATNIAERVIYRVTGKLHEVNVDLAGDVE